MRLMQLIKSLDNFKIHSGARDFEIGGISCNSKNIGDNFVFIAIKGAKEDGNKFIREAVEKGAKAVVIKSSCLDAAISQKGVVFIEVADDRSALAKLAAEFFGNPSLKMKTVGITGTNGKTTTAYLIEAILKEAGLFPGVIGTVNYRFQDKVVSSKNTTPGPIELQAMLADMLHQGVNYAVMEVSSHGLDQNRTAQVNFSSAIFTNLTQDHLDYHNTKENYFQAKAKLFKGLEENSFAVINLDDEYGRRLAGLTQAKIITYAIDNQADFAAKEIKMDLAQAQFIINYLNSEVRLKTRLIGKHNLYNMLAAFAWAIEEGLDLKCIKRALENFSFVPGRLERIESDAGFSIFVDYAHTEDALKNVLNSLRQISRKRIIVVFGCGGERDKDKRPKMGRVVSELADYAIITNDNPRSENPEEIIADIKKGMAGDNYCVVLERLEAIKKSLSLAEAGDVVLVAGKGHEDYQIFKDKTIHFDDCEVIRQCLKSLNY
jgi:UDP-N-acetylmuramoyl-L-alanyl-D-glutamate--2,6-diaminopimelate ligase